MSETEPPRSEAGERAALLGVPEFGVSRLLLVATGSVSTADLPFWGTWLRTCYPDLEIMLALTRSARRFVTPTALHGRINGEVIPDTWPEDDPRALHVELAEWAEAVLVYPATLHFTARLALGLADSPALLAAQCTKAPIVVAPALPPGGVDSPAYLAHRSALAARPNVVVMPPRPGISVTTGRPGAWAPALLPHCLEALERLRDARDPGSREETDVSGAASEASA
ncbi:flavoprotein [Marinactinospora thermotolerans]|uniref:Phosphopantothenoylcysteine synthetase/decarboxylase n=1 Tax=Marinactinospora thermotolerans DSM 45154 TaxID=1122192 RepID=A0A1T4N916_9ACTN|nr:flavoprotein [Marinactinospora thermotolerans]SJZ75593.1 Phosphopantothenoylcysteine synthetase/decarboxylase [Marinactinospora thermotolerans DSM 45154]